MAAATLLIIQGENVGTRFRIEDSFVGIGRGVRNAFRISDTEISRRHAQIERVDDSYELSDLNSSNGTFVNGKRIRRKLLSSGDRVQFGRTLLVFLESHADSLDPAQSVELVPGTAHFDRSRIVARINDADVPLLSEQDRTAADDGAGLMDRLQTLYRVAEEVVRPSVSLEQMLDRLLQLSLETIDADRGCILLIDADDGSYRSVASRHRVDSAEPERMPVSRSILAYVLEHRQAIRTSDASKDSRFDRGESIFREGIREAMCVPLKGHTSLLGVIYADTMLEWQPEQDIPGRFSDDQLRLLLAIGRQAAVAVEASQYQAAMLKAEQLAAVGQTIAVLSHHVKNILQGVRGGSYLIDLGLNENRNEMIRKGWRIVERNQNKIYDLVMDMLTYSKERQPVLEQADLNETVAEVCELMQARAEESGIEFDFQLASSLPRCLFDSEAIHRAVLNITINALDAVESSESGKVLLQTYFDEATDQLIVAVSDNGPGIPAEQIPHVFNIFESSKGSRGTGLGLAVSLKILREHGGDIHVESEPGKGCRFLLMWPHLEEDDSGGDRVTRVE